MLGSGPAAYWRLGENPGGSVALDTMGGADGTYVNVTGLGAAGALARDADTAVDLSGSDDYVVAPGTSPSLQLQDSFTIELWVRLGTTAQSQKYLLNKGNHYAVLYGYVPQTVELFLGAGTFTGEDPRPYSAITVDDTAWHHIVYSYDRQAGLFYGYKDGEAAFAPVAIDFGLGTTGADLFLGAAGSGGLNNVDATLDEVAIYDRALLSERGAGSVRSAGLRAAVRRAGELAG
ncbi:MAG: hypothetical protein KatS3mg076_2019 [Candidatus Binatia bacterium]|nr:MAG: hypothetical protein KatS3mg076_2019 [Candidatus Binatia bacterium]